MSFIVGSGEKLQLVKSAGDYFEIPIKSFRLNRMSKFRKKPIEVILHCSDSDNKKYNALAIHRDHLTRDNNTWGGCGYHFVIEDTGRIVRARPLKYIGSHCKEGGRNSYSIGICVMGRWKLFNPEQAQSLKHLLIKLGFAREIRCGLGLKSLKRISGHNRYANDRTCPNFIVPFFLNTELFMTYECYKDG